MENHPRNSPFANISQRVVHSYCHSLVPLPPGSDESQRDLHAFFESLYAALYQTPDRFGLPVTPDAYITGSEPNQKDYKQEVTRKYKKPKDLLERGMAFLLSIGQIGDLRGSALAVGQGEYAALVKETKVGKPFLKGLAWIGLKISEQGDAVLITSSQHPAMLPAFSALSKACARHPNANVSQYNFARCDFRTLDEGYNPAATDLFGVYDPVDYDRVLRLHQFFFDLRYRPIIAIHDINAWEVQYQGRSKVKGSPLLRIEYQPRYLNPVRVNIKCASSARIIPLIAQAPRFLQEDFSRRLNKCNEDACGWCKDKKSLGPSVFEFDGEKRTVCWWINQDIPELNDDALLVIEQYALLHEKLDQI